VERRRRDAGDGEGVATARMGTADVDARSGWGCGDVAVTRVSGGDERVDSRKQ
jgi:hypothetical protein